MIQPIESILLPAAQGAAGLAAREARSAKEAAVRFEAIFLEQLVKEMMPREGQSYFGSGSGAEVFKNFFIEAVAGEMAPRGVLGIRPLLEKELNKSDQRKERNDKWK
ncbi:MAG: hypothetical protein HY717_17430 [Planctomycetes bacterium]|nr:hypothetical protein [Planctomycetota bacterium]